MSNKKFSNMAGMAAEMAARGAIRAIGLEQDDDANKWRTQKGIAYDGSATLGKHAKKRIKGRKREIDEALGY